jgi:Pro-kumamolisin, activation domain/Subtilase family
MRRTVVAVVVALAAPVAALAVRCTPAVAGTLRDPSISAAAAPALPAAGRVLGPVAAGSRVSFEVALAPRDPAALTAFVNAISTPGSPDYRQYLAKGQFGPRFGASAREVAAVSSTLARAGLTPGPVSANRLLLPVSGTAAHIDAAFGTSLHDVRLASGAVVAAAVAAVRVPGAIAGDVESVVGLSLGGQFVPGASFASSTASDRERSDAVTGDGTTPCSAAQDGGYTANQIAQAYDFDPLYETGDHGAGQTIAFVEFAPFTASDISTFQSCYGTSASVSTTDIDGGAGGKPIDEDLIDIEDVIGLAPRANVDVYEAPNNYDGLYDTWQQIASDDNAQVMSDSWYACETTYTNSQLAALSALLEQMASQGQSAFGISGDVGSAGCNHELGVAVPAEQPYITGVGGTNLNALGNPPAVAPTETAWTDGGGGISSVWQMPLYQSGPGVINTYSTGSQCGAPIYDDCREVPDVSADASPSTPYSMYLNGQWEKAFGTSIAAPTWAALTALINDSSSSCQSVPIGFLNPALYRLAQSTPSDFNDITVGNNDGGVTTFGDVYPATKGYDMATGLGTPVGANLAQSLCGEGPLWTPQVDSHVVIDGAPSATDYDGEVYVAYASDGNIDVSDYTEDFGWPVEVPDGHATGSPSIAVSGGTLAVLWTDGASGDVLYSAESKSGTWSSPVQVGGGLAQSSTGPALSAFGDSLIAVWKGATTDHLYYSVLDSGNWSKQTELPSDMESPDTPAVTYVNGLTDLLGWTTTGGTIDFTWFGLLGPTSVQPVSYAATNASPAVAAIGGRFYIGWKGVSTDEVLYTSAPNDDDTSFAVPHWIPSALTSAGPAFAVTGPTLWDLWKGKSSSELHWSSSVAPAS